MLLGQIYAQGSTTVAQGGPTSTRSRGSCRTTARTRSTTTSSTWHIYQTDHFEIYLLPGKRAAPRARGRQLRGERLPARELGPAARSQRARAAHHLQDAQRVRAAEHRAGRIDRRRAGICRRRAPSHGAADRPAVGSALRPDRPRADARLPVRHHPDVADPPQPAAVGARRRRRVRARHLGSARPDDGARRRRRRHHPAR